MDEYLGVVETYTDSIWKLYLRRDYIICVSTSTGFEAPYPVANPVGLTKQKRMVPFISVLFKRKLLSLEGRRNFLERVARNKFDFP